MDGGSSDEISEKTAEANFIAWYDELCAERISMLEAEESYKRRIKELEQNNLDLLQAFDEVQGEIQQLRGKYEPKMEENKTEYREPYDIVFRDREELRKENASLKTKLRKSYLNKNNTNYVFKSPGRSKNVDDWERVSKSMPTIEDLHRPNEMCERNTAKSNFITNRHRLNHSDMKSNRTYNQLTRKIGQQEDHNLLLSNINKLTTSEKEKPVSQVKVRSVDNKSMQRIHEKAIKSIPKAFYYAKSNIEAMHKRDIPFSSVETEDNKHAPFVKSYSSIYLSRKNLRKVSSIHLPAIQKNIQYPTEIFKISRETLF